MVERQTHAHTLRVHIRRIRTHWRQIIILFTKYILLPTMAGVSSSPDIFEVLLLDTSYRRRAVIMRTRRCTTHTNSFPSYIYFWIPFFFIPFFNYYHSSSHLLAYREGMISSLAKWFFGTNENNLVLMMSEPPPYRTVSASDLFIPDYYIITVWLYEYCISDPIREQIVIKI